MGVGYVIWSDKKSVMVDVAEGEAVGVGAGYVIWSVKKSVIFDVSEGAAVGSDSSVCELHEHSKMINKQRKMYNNLFFIDLLPLIDK